MCCLPEDLSQEEVSLPTLLALPTALTHQLGVADRTAAAAGPGRQCQPAVVAALCKHCAAVLQQSLHEPHIVFHERICHPTGTMAEWLRRFPAITAS
jgi:hypothetical protein